MKRFLCVLLTVVLMSGMASMAVLAYSITGPLHFTDSGGGLGLTVLNEDGRTPTGSFSYTAGSPGNTSQITGDDVYLGQKLYFMMADPQFLSNNVPINELFDTNNFTFKLVRDQGSKYLNGVTATTKQLSANLRKPYIVVDLKDATITDDSKLTFDVYFKARRDQPNNGGAYLRDETYNVRFSLWVRNNKDDSGDTSIRPGESTVIKPVGGDKNIIRWEDSNVDIACLEFDASDNPSSFYVKLSTKQKNNIYEDYGDPLDADLFFRDFSTSNTIDSTSRGTLTLYDPWSEDYGNNDNRFRVDPSDQHLYIIDPDGYIRDITDDASVTYVRGDNTDAGIPGWQIRTRTLGSYILSDTDLDVENYKPGDDVEFPDESLDGGGGGGTSSKPNQGNPQPPATGSSDFVALAALLGVASVATIVGLKRRRR